MREFEGSRFRPGKGEEENRGSPIPLLHKVCFFTVDINLKFDVINIVICFIPYLFFLSLTLQLHVIVPDG